MKKRAPVSKIMTPNPISVNETQSVMEVVQIFDENDIRHIPVVSGKKLKGMISRSDIDRISFVTNNQEEKVNTAIYKSLSLEQIMTKQLDTIQADDQIRDVAAILASSSYHALPVMKGEQLTGIVTSTDIIKFLLEQY